MKKTTLPKRILSLLLCLALITGYIPLVAIATPLSRSVVTQTVTDPGTAHTWETMMGTNTDGNRYAGRVWVDKSVYKEARQAPPSRWLFLRTKPSRSSSPPWALR